MAQASFEEFLNESGQKPPASFTDFLAEQPEPAKPTQTPQPTLAAASPSALPLVPGATGETPEAGAKGSLAVKVGDVQIKEDEGKRGPAFIDKSGIPVPKRLTQEPPATFTDFLEANRVPSWKEFKEAARQPIVDPAKVDDVLGNFLVGPFGMYRGAAKVMANMTSPENLAIMASSGGLYSLASRAGATTRAALTGLQGAMSLYFGKQLAEGAYGTLSSPEAQRAWQEKDWDTLMRIGGETAAQGVLAIAAAKHVGDVAKGGTRALENTIDQHNAKAEDLFRQEQAAGRRAQATTENYGAPIPIAIDGKPYKLEIQGFSKEGRPGYQVVDSSGNVIYAGHGNEVKGYLASRKAVGIPAPITEPTPIVQRAAEAADRAQAKIPEIFPQEEAAPEPDFTQEEALGHITSELSKRLTDIRKMESHLAGGGDIQMSPPTMRTTTPEQRRQMMEDNIKAQRGIYEGELASVEKEFGPVVAKDLRHKLEAIESFGDFLKQQEQAPPQEEHQPSEEQSPPAISPEVAQGVGAATVFQDHGPSAVVRMNPKDIYADPGRFQFKADTGGKAGVGDELKKVKKWDPEAGSVLMVWLDPVDGKTYVINGHHRLDLAKRLDVPGVDVRFTDAQTAGEARARGALMNIREGRGTPVDAAKIFRELEATPEDLEAQGVSLQGQVARQGMGLSRLAEPIFDRVASGDMPVERGAIIGESLPEHADQTALVRLLENSTKRPTNEEVRELIRMVKEGPRKAIANENAQASLFGEPEEAERSLMLERAAVSQYVRGKLAQERRLFGPVGSEGAASSLEQGGNVIKPEENRKLEQQIAQAQALYDKFSVTSGPIADELDEAAGAIATAGGKDEAAKQRAYERIRKHLTEALARGTQALFGGPGEGHRGDAGEERPTQAGSGKGEGSSEAEKPAEPAAEEVKPEEKVPDRVRASVQFHLGKLRAFAAGLEQARDVDKKFGGDGRYEHEYFTLRRPEIEDSLAKIGEFKERAAKKGIDADAFLDELGGEPKDLKLSKKGQEYGGPETKAPTTPVEKPATPVEAPAPEPKAGLRAMMDAVYQRIESGEGIKSNPEFWQIADKAFGGTRASGAYTARDAYDAMEAGVNLWIEHALLTPDALRRRFKPLQDLRELLSKLPTQVDRDNTQVEFQQFSTPPTIAYVASKALQIQPGEVVLEPSSGTGSLAVMAKQMGATVQTNDLDPRRRELLREIGFDPTDLNAEQIANLMARESAPRPTGVIMNPPFSATGGRLSAHDNEVGYRHVKQALARMVNGGRAVIILGEGSSFEAPAARAFWVEAMKRYNVRMNVSLDGKEYQKYGTTFGTQLIVIDKTGPTPGEGWNGKLANIIHGRKSLEEVLDAIGSRLQDRQGPGAGAPATQRPGDLGNPPGSVLGGGGEAPAETPGGGPVRRPGRRPGTAEHGGNEPAGEPPVVSSAQPGNQPTESGQPGPVQGGRGNPADAGAGRVGAARERIRQRIEARRNQQAPAAAPQQAPASRKEQLPTVPAPAPQTAPADVQSARDRIRERIEARRKESEPLHSIQQPSRPQDDLLTEEMLDDLITVGVEHFQNGADTFEKWAPLMSSDLGSEVTPYLDIVWEELPVDRAQQQEEQSQIGEEEAGGTFTQYRPAKVRHPVKHPAKIVEASSMAAVEPPDPTYRPALRTKALQFLSDAQMETPIYAGQRNELRLPNGSRAWFFNGDGTGVGKGAQNAAFIQDNWDRGRRKVLWVSASSDLLKDAQRDFNDTGGEDIAAKARMVNDFKPAYKIDLKEGVIFSTYASLPKRLEQIMEWLAGGNDGEEAVIVLDEAHKAKNAVGEEEGEASQAGQAVVAIQEDEILHNEKVLRLPNARGIYSSATGATDPKNMGYMVRLGLWGRETSFPTGFQQFLAAIESGGVTAMEAVARDMKSLGMYVSRNISYEGVEYSEVIHELTPQQRRMYDAAAGLWQRVLQDVETAIGITGTPGRRRGRVMAQLFGAEQRFFNSVITAFKLPAVIRQVEKTLEDGKSAVVSLIGTNEAATARMAREATAEGLSLDDLDFTPKQALMKFIENLFPTEQWEDYEDEDGKVKQRPVVDGEGKPVHDLEALEMKQALLDQMDVIVLPGNPLDDFIEYFRKKDIPVAELTGRKQKLEADENDRMKLVKRGVGKRVNLEEMKAFQDGRKRVAIISRAASTGISLHSDGRAGNKQRRVQIVWQLDWSADSTMQSFGRTHRSNQVIPPEYVLMSSDVGGEKRFSSTVARRLSSLGALTKGQRDASGGGELAKYNFESEWGLAAMEDFYARLRHSEDVPGVSYRDALDDLRDMGLAKVDPDTGQTTIAEGIDRNVPRFLNRVLALEVDRQNALFGAFTDIFQQVVDRAKEEGNFDEGVSNIRGALSVQVVGRPDIVHKDQTTGAETKHYTLRVNVETEPVPWEKVEQYAAVDQTRPDTGHLRGGFYRQNRSDNVVYAKFSRSKTLANGDVEWRYRLYRPGGEDDGLLPESDLRSKYSPVPAASVEDLWKREFSGVPATKPYEMHVISGAILPIWSRLHTGGNRRKMVRATADDGQRIVGAMIPNKDVGEVLSNLGINRAINDPAAIFNAVLGQGTEVRLVDGMSLKRTNFKGDQAIELANADPTKYRELREMGLINDQVYTPRMRQVFLVPTNEKVGIGVLERLLKRYPPLASPPLHSIKKNALPFASALQRTVERMPSSLLTGGQVLSHLYDRATRNPLPGASSTDISRSGLDEFLEGRAGVPVSKQEILDHLEDNPETQSPLFQRARIAGPAMRDGMSNRELLMEAQAYGARVEDYPVLFVNEQAMELFHRAILHPDGRYNAGALFSQTATMRLISVLRHQLDFPSISKLDEGEKGQVKTLVETLQANRRVAKLRPLVVVQAGPGMTEQDTTNALNEELDHATQLSATGPVYEDHLDSAAFLAHPLAQKALQALQEAGYNSSDPGMTLEIGVRLMRPGLYRELELTLEEGAELAEFYIDSLERTHGAEQMVPVTQRVYAAFGRSLGGRRNQQDQATNPTGHALGKPEFGKPGEDETPKRKRSVSRRVDEAQWELPLAQAKRRDSGQYLGAGFGALQPAYEKHVAPVLFQAQTTLEEVAETVQHVFAPRAGVNPNALNIMMEMKGEREKKLFVLEQTMGAIKKMFDRMPRMQQLAFLDNIKEGKPQSTPELQKIADLYRQMDDALYAQVLKYRPNLSYKEDHFRIFWRRIPGPLRLDVIDQIEKLLGDTVTNKKRLVRAIRGPRGPEILDLIVGDGGIDPTTAATFIDQKKQGKNGEALLNAEGRREVRRTLKHAGIVKESFADRSRRRPLQGSKGFLKHSTLANVSEGIEKGGEPVSYNPQTLFELGINDAMRFITAQKMWEKLKGIGFRRFVRNGDPAPPGYVKIDDNIARVYYRPEGTNVFVPSGEWYVEENAARLLNNFLSRDAIRANPIGRGVLMFKNITTALELAISPFHAVFETIEAMGSDLGVNITRLVNQGALQGDPQAAVRGIRDMLYTPAAPGTLSREGGSLIRYVANKQEFLATARGAKFVNDYPEIDRIIDDLFVGGAKLGMHENYKINTLGAWYGNLSHIAKGEADAGDYLGAVLRAVPSLNELAMKPLFEKYIPRLKIGLFLKEYSQQLDQYAWELSVGKMRRETLAREVWDRVENRFGEMNFDNLFWNNTFKTALQLLFRSVTWKLGNFRGFGGAIAEQSGLIKNRRVGIGPPPGSPPNGGGGGNGAGGGPQPRKKLGVPYLSPGVAWAFLGLTITSAAIANIIQLFSGEGHTQSLDDVVAPRIGGTDERGKPRRVNILTYLKDLVRFFRDPVRYVEGSLSSMISRAPELYKNRDFFGNFIYDPDAPFIERWIQGGMYAIGQPFMVSQFQRTADLGGTPTQQAANALGFTRAASDIDMTPAEVKASELAGRFKTPMKPEELLRHRMINTLASNLRSKEPGFEEALAAAVARGIIKPNDEKTIREHAATPYLVRLFVHLGVEDAITVWNLASPTEKELLRDRFEKKEHLIENVPADRREAVRSRFNRALGITPGVSRLGTVPGSERTESPTFA